jgi:hypothetical protein
VFSEVVEWESPERGDFPPLPLRAEDLTTSGELTIDGDGAKLAALLGRFDFFAASSLEMTSDARASLNRSCRDRAVRCFQR